MRASMMRRAKLVIGFLVTFAFVIPASTADAQWYFVGYLGANSTTPGDVSIDLPASNLSLTFHDVEFDAHPFESPQYYGWRLGKLFAAGGRIGVELEFTHLKVIGLTDAVYDVDGSSGSASFPPGAPMRAIVERYSMTHGLNFLVGNVVVRHPLGSGRAAFVGRVGVGSTIPHTETTVLAGSVDKYESGGFGFHAAAGLDVQLNGRLSFVVEYKFTRASPEISVAGGTGQTTASSHHVAFGLAFGMSR
jgi:opacity protein-like surface antigen